MVALAQDPTFSQNQLPTQPELKDVLDLWRKAIFLSMNCHAIGTIQAFNPAKQTAQITINYTKTYFEGQATGASTPKQVSYPLMLDVPCICLGGGTAALTLPITKGDECLVMFNDRDIDNWFSGSSSAAVNTPRLHSFSDGIALVGLRSLANVLADYNMNAVELRNGPNKISVGGADGDITISVPATDLTVTFRKEGGVFIQNPIGNFHFADNADVTFDTGTVVGLFGHGGHVKFENSTGELITAIIQAFATATAGGFPVLADTTVIQSFKE